MDTPGDRGLLIAVRPVAGQAGRAQVDEGNRFYSEGRFDEAHSKYLEALAANPESGLIRFNDGNALYQNQDYQRAMEAYQRAIETGDPALASSAWYNMGNALYRQQQLEPALDAYKEALRLNPRDVDAKHNLERVLEQMQEQEQQQQQQGDEGEEGEEGESDDQQNGGQQQPQPGDESDDGESDGNEGDGQQQQQPQPQPQQGDPGQQDAQSSDPSDGNEEGEGAPEPREGEMTREEAERLLDAISENAEDVNRRPAPARGRLPRKPW